MQEAAAAAAAWREGLGWAAFGAAPLGQWSSSALPSSLHAQRSQPECGNMHLLVPQKIPTGKWGKPTPEYRFPHPTFFHL